MLMTSKPWRAPAVSACRTATRVGRSGSRDICSDLTYVAFCWTDEPRKRLQGPGGKMAAMRIAVVGAGGVGGYFGGRLAAAGADVTFLARGAHLDAIRERGLTIQSFKGDLHLPKVNATDDPAAI